MATFRSSKDCACDIAANFPIPGNLGIISASLRTNANVIVVGSSLRLYSPATGDLSITAYAPLDNSDKLDCASSASVSFDWDQRTDCDTLLGIRMRFIPRGREKAQQEGKVTRQIRMEYINAGKPYLTFNASAASGPHTPYFFNHHYDGFNFIYTGGPIQITSSTKNGKVSIPFLNNILPATSELYMTNFSWSYTPPDVPNVSYSFLFSYSGGI